MNIFDSIKNLNWREVNIADVLQGCMDAYLTDFLSPEKREKVTRISVYRMKFCAECHMNSNGWCDNTGTKKIVNVETGQEVTGCGCSLHCKTAKLDQQCPASIWKAVS